MQHTYLRDPQSTADVDPLGPTAGGLHGSAFLGTQQTLRLNPQGTGAAEPAALWNLEDSVTGLGRHGNTPKKKREKEGRFTFHVTSINLKARERRPANRRALRQDSAQAPHGPAGLRSAGTARTSSPQAGLQAPLPGCATTDTPLDQLTDH